MDAGDAMFKAFIEFIKVFFIVVKWLIELIAWIFRGIKEMNSNDGSKTHKDIDSGH
jgi:hypothetical protein